MAGITGLGSGLDIDSLVSTTVSAEKAPKQAQLDRVEKATTTKISALGQLTSALSTFQSALSGLNSTSLFNGRTASSSDTSIVKATASATAQSGSYSLKVTSLATASQTATKNLSISKTAEFTSTSNTLTVHLGAADSGAVVNIDAGATLEDIRDSLNEQLESLGITASLITNPSDGSTRLVMSSSETGEGKDIYITANGSLADLAIGDAAADALGGTSMAAVSGGAAGYLQQSKNAVFSINGLPMESGSNSISDAVDGVTFSLAAADSSKTVTVSVAQDKSSVTSNINKFVSAYNELVKTTSQLTAVATVANGEKAPVVAPLVGDSSVRNLLSAIRREFSSESTQGNISMLTDLGITTQKDGTLSVNSEKLSKALSENYEEVAGFFTGTTGLMNRLDKVASLYTNSSTGIITQRVTALNQTLTSVDNAKAALNTRMIALQERLYKQYNTMDNLVAQLNSTSSWLTSTLEGLSTSSKNS